MARIPEEQIERIKQEVSLVRLVESCGIALKKHGKDYLGLCPFHDDKEPSLVISPDKNLWHCLGACGEGGDVIQWVMKHQGVGFPHAVQILRDGAELTVASGAQRSQKRHLEPVLSDPVETQKALASVVDYYHQTLKQSPEAFAYLKQRGLDHPEIVEQFRLGFANKTLTYRLPAAHTQAGKAVRGQLRELGIYRQSGHEHMNGCLVIPVLGLQGEVKEVYGRRISPENKIAKDAPRHLYLPGPHAGVFNEQALQASDEIILCESLIDALTFWCAGYRNVTAAYGTSGFTDDHLAAFKQHEIKRVLIAYDRDEAGNTAAEKLAKKLNENGIDTFRIQFPKGMDANEYALQVKPAAKSLGLVIRKAEWLGKGKGPKLTTTTNANPLANAEPMAEVIEEPIEPLPSLAADIAADLPEPTEASPLPEPPKPIDAEVTEQEVVMTLGDRKYRIRGLSKNMSYEVLKVNVLASRGDHVHIDTFDLYQSRPRQTFVNQASAELGVQDDVIKKDLGKVLLKLEALQEKQIKQTLEPETETPSLDEDEHQAALELLKDSNLLDRILTDFHTAGVVGEETNKLVGYLACVSRKLDKPLAVIIQSTSAAGKSSLMDAVLNLMPEEERVQYSAMTGQSLFYMGETNLKNKILAIAEEEGAENASYALKLLQSEGELTIASTGKDESSGNMVTKEYRVEGPVMLFLTTTAIDIDEELMNRCLVLTVNESREQTQAIHAMQRKQQTLEGLLQNEDRKHLVQLHRNAQRLLKPLLVANPYAEQLTFIDDKTRTRRDHMKYLTLIRTIALLHQYQREVKTVTHGGQVLRYIEVIPQDIETANRLAHDVLGRTLDELPPQTRTLLKRIHQMVADACKVQGIEQSHYRFSRRDVRDFTSWGNTQLKLHLRRLEEMEYLLVHRGGRGQSFVYELLYQGEGEDGNAFLPGLIELEKLNSNAKKSGVNDERSGSSRPQVGAKSGGGRAAENGAKPDTARAESKADKKSPKTTLRPQTNNRRATVAEAQAPGL